MLKEEAEKLTLESMVKAMFAGATVSGAVTGFVRDSGETRVRMRADNGMSLLVDPSMLEKVNG